MISAYQSYSSFSSVQWYQQQGNTVSQGSVTQSTQVVRHTQLDHPVGVSQKPATVEAPVVKEPMVNQPVVKEPVVKEPTVDQLANKPTTDSYTPSQSTYETTYLRSASFSSSSSTEQVGALEAIESPEEPLTDAASTILSAISAQLSRDVLDGASDEELQSRLKAGLEGFLQGFNEAFEIIGASGMLNEEVANAIFQTFDQVVAGVNELSQQLLGEDLPGIDQIQRPPMPEFEAEEPELPAMPSASSQYAFAADSIQQREFSLTVTTADGDVVTLQSSALKASSFEYYASGADDLDMLLATQDAISTTYREQEMRFSVEGELDSGELQALTELFAEINEVASLFYEGDVQAAYEHVLEIGLDGEELASYALNLTSTSVTRVQEAYGSNEGDDRGKGMQGLGEMMQHIQGARGIAELFANGNELLQDISKLFDRPDQQPVSQLIESLPSIESVEEPVA